MSLVEMSLSPFYDIFSKCGERLKATARLCDERALLKEMAGVSEAPLQEMTSTSGAIGSIHFRRLILNVD